MSENIITWRLENEKVGRLLRHYAVPAVIGTMVNSLYNIVDRIFIGQGVGALAISGLTLTFPIMILLQGFGMLVGAGAAARVSIFLGRKANDEAEHVLGNALTLTILLGLISIIPAMIFMEDLLHWFGGSDQTVPYAAEYLYIAIPASMFATLSFSFNAVMRASGYPKKAMYLMLLGAVMNVILDPIFIFWLDLGIQGAAIATVISMAVCAYFVLRHFTQKNTLIRFKKQNFKLNKAIVFSIVAIGVSPFSMQVAGSLVNVILNNSLYTYGGDLAVGANGIVSSVGMLLLMLNMGIAMGMQPIVGFNYGAGKYKRANDTLKLVMIINTCIMTIGFIGGVFFPELIVKGFTNDAELVRLSAQGLRISMLVFFFIGTQISITQFFQSIGVAWKAMFLSLTRQFVYLIPALIFLPPVFGLDGVWFAYPFSDFLAAITAWIFLAYHIKKEKKKVLY